MMSLRCLLLVALAPAAMAVRARFAADSAPASAVHVVDKIGSLLQALQDKSQSKVRRTMHDVHLTTQRVSEGITPESKESLNTLIEKVVDAIKLKVDVKIKIDHKNTQDEIDKRLLSVQKYGTYALIKHRSAVDADKKLFVCIGDERELLAVSEELEKTAADSRSNANEACQLAQDTTFERLATEDQLERLAFQCDSSVGDRCDHAKTAFGDAVDKFLEDLEGAVDGAEATHASAKTACSDANDDTIKKQSAMSDAYNLYNDKAEECQQLIEPRDEAICLFGLKLQQKCKGVTKFEKLMDNIDETDGGDFSHPDRVEQWRASQVTQCMLEQVMIDFQINSDTMTACNKKVNFDGDVGLLNRKAAEFAITTSTENFSCKEEMTKIKFFGQRWVKPEMFWGEDEIKTDDYERQLWEPEVDVTKQEAFSFCGRGKR